MKRVGDIIITRFIRYQCISDVNRFNYIASNTHIENERLDLSRRNYNVAPYQHYLVETERRRRSALIRQELRMISLNRIL
jgi:hypothetical protein